MSKVSDTNSRTTFEAAQRSLDPKPFRIEGRFIFGYQSRMGKFLLAAMAIRFIQPFMESPPRIVVQNSPRWTTPIALYSSEPERPSKASRVRSSARYQPGIAEIRCRLPKHERTVWGTHQNAGFLPQSVAENLEGKHFKDFSDLRRAIWMEIGRQNPPEFSKENIQRMLDGKAPLADESQQTDEQNRYEIHHITPLHQGGKPLLLCNLMLLTPKFHREVLDPSYHYQQNSAPTGRAQKTIRPESAPLGASSSLQMEKIGEEETLEPDQEELR